ncbi:MULTISPECIES: peptide deformylase [unclassified Meiothermus]|uniref:peptide deformylase n=1 Tax=unclassified Meiothermus TaxID=370471 RepID=UPI000D7C2F97|nr:MULTISPECIES: peptide deformylase [unclassified Meiothermus]PZA06111.1 peptide deformylase [Meiothermus sp. Pnk-1]RYM35385.1 peptide deformylase [Meiothermus sp. PNK-Is4]
MIYPIRLYGDPVLRKRASSVKDFSEIPRLAENMFETMFEARGVGLAAPQVGRLERLFVFAEYVDAEDEEEGEEADLKTRVKNQWVMVNPVITYRAGQQISTEGCLSIPGLYSEEVPRDLQVRVEYQDERGEKKTQEFEGYLAVVVQHELDHLDGTLFFERLPKALKAAFLEEHRQELAEMQRRAKAFLKELKAERLA